MEVVNCNNAPSVLLYLQGQLEGVITIAIIEDF